MIDARILRRAVIAGTVLQIVLSLSGYFFPWVAIRFFMFGRMMISASAGYLYGMELGRGYAAGALGGAIAGGLCVVPAIALSVLLGDTDASMLAVGTGISILTGGVGGAFGQIAAILRKLGY
jgi:hypothetical protein